MFPTTSVQGGVRPVIVVSNNKANTYSSVITVVPLTSRIYKKRYLPTHVFISKYDMTGIRKGSLALAEQVMSISTKCIIEKCGRVNKWSLDRVLKAVRIQMGMEGEVHGGMIDFIDILIHILPPFITSENPCNKRGLHNLSLPTF
jgi:mRNA-degrading endonuclease toxin of MazEF toxin-antitoxin module